LLYFLVYREWALFTNGGTYRLFLICTVQPGVRHVKSSDRSAAEKTDDGFQGQGCPC